MKKAFATALSILLVITSIPTFAFASDNNALETITDTFFDSAKVVEVTDDSVTLQNVETLDTRTENNHTYVDKCTNQLTLVATDDSARKELLATSTEDAYKYKSATDSSGTVKIYTRIFYTVTNSGGHYYLDLTKVTGGFSGSGSGANLGNGVFVTSQSCTARQKGIDINGQNRNYSTTKTFDKTKRSWSFTVPASWAPIEDLSSFVTQASYTVKLKRTNSNWSVTCVNNATSD